jgi:alpha-2-macroglobulin
MKLLFLQSALANVLTSAAHIAIITGKELGQFLKQIVGTWQPAPWMSALATFFKVHVGTAIAHHAAQAWQWIRLHTRWVVIALVLVAMSVLGFHYGKKWWYGLTPEQAAPISAKATLQAPSRTVIEADNEADRAPNPLVINFSADVAPLAQVGKEALGINMDPAREGRWSWAAANRIEFQPKEDWPIGQKYKVKLGSETLARHIDVDTTKFEFTTPSFTAKIDSAEFYQDPTNPTMRRALYQVRFSHPVNPAELEKKITLSINDECKGGFFGLIKCSSEKFSVTLDRFKLIATIQSAPLKIPETNQAMVLRVASGLASSKGGDGLQQDLSQSVDIPSLYSLEIKSMGAGIVTGENGEPEHVLHVAASMPVHEREMARSVQAWLLPEKDNAKDEEKKNWANDPAAITDAVLKRSSAVKLEAIASEREVAESLSFKMPKAEGGQYLLVRVAKGLKTPGGHQTGKPRQDVILLKTFAPELSIMSKGSLLALSGEKKLPILVRDLPGIKIEIGRLLPQQLQHLVTQSQGDFSNPEFSNGLSADNLTERFEQAIPLKLRPGKSHYETVDFGKYLKADDKDKRGIFLLTVRGFDPNKKEPEQGGREANQNEDEGNEGEGDAAEREQALNEAMGKQDKRLVLVTDLGMVIKKSIDGSREVFVQSIGTGKSVEGAVVEVWARNGTVVMSQNTDSTGRATLANLSGFQRERVPVVVVVRKAGDMSFMPLNRSDRNLDMSRFDVGGLRSAGVPNQMTAYLFSDRGIYRPGDTMNIGLIVKAGNWGTSLKDLPVEVEIVDARGLRVRREKLRLGAGGAAEISHATSETSPTGNYTVNLFLPRQTAAGAAESSEITGLLLGSTSVKVQEFLPDRTKVTAKLSAPATQGWIKPSEVKAFVNVQNLFGTPAPNRRVDGVLTLTPAYPSFKGYSDYAFYDPTRAKDKQTDELGTVQTTEKGDAEFDLRLERFEAATYQLHFLARAFEPEGGRSVSAEATAMVSDLPYVIGIKTDGNTSYISKGAVQNTSIIAINPQTQKIALNGLKLDRVERKVLSVLVKQNNGVYRYESRRKEVSLETKAFALAASGTSLALNTATPGNFAYIVRNGEGLELNRVEYSVAGTANVSRSLDRNAELQLTLNKKDYNPGEDLEISIRAPYVGAGLITIERDKVYSHAWFKTDKTASVQKITLPKDFEGTGYVTVHFVRDLASDEIYTSPLSYGSVPFATSLSKRTANIQLTSSELVKPGQTIKMKLTSDKPTRAVVFAVDEGILQVARYKTPDPLAHFFQKRALEVSTMQTLDLILPEFKKLMRAAAPGGDGEGELGKHLNPFKRKRDKPVAYWSGLVDVNGSREFSYTVPESFNGSLRVMAVAVNDEATSAKTTKSVVRGDMVILPNIPTSLAPGDTVEVGVGLANNILNSGKEVPIALKLETTGGIEVITSGAASNAATQTLKINERSEGSTRYQIRAKAGAGAQLGSGSVIFTAQYKTFSARLSTDVSVRPASPYVSLVQAGSFQGAGELKSQADLYPNFRKSDVAVSSAPWAFSVGLIRYLEAYPHGCTEQITSQTYPAVMLSNRPELYTEMMRGKDTAVEKDARKAADQTLARYIVQLRGRQTSEGGFALWPGSSADTFATVYAVQLLVEAKERKLNVPQDMLQKANVYLQGLIGGNTRSTFEWRQRTQAAYLLTRQGIVAPTALSNLREALRSNSANATNMTWSKDIGAVYLAASYQLVKQDTVAAELLQPVWAELLDRTAKTGAAGKRTIWDQYYDPIVHDAALLQIVAKHFPLRLKTMPVAAWTRMAEQLKEGWYNSLSSASMLMAIDAYFQAVNQNVAGKVSATATDLDGKKLDLVLGALNPIARAQVPANTGKLKLSNGGDFPLYYSWAEQGFEKNVPNTALMQGMEIIHEVLDSKGAVVTQAKLGEELQVRVRVRSLDKASIQNVALVDVLPGGLEPVLQAASDSEANADTPLWQRRMGGRGSWRVDYADIREDRVVFYGSVGKDMTEVIYKVRATNVGEFVTPAAYGEAMYDRRVFARSAGGKFSVIAK